MQWMNRNWVLRENWGIIHPNYPYMYTDENCVEIRDTDLVLKTLKSPRFFHQYGEVPWARGLVMSSPFLFGRFTITATLPQGANLWPAIWLYGVDSWPPEIDIMEGYSNRRGNYRNISTSSFRSFFHSIRHPHKIEANYHIEPTGGIGAHRLKFNWGKDLTKPIQFEMRWSPDSITMWGNGDVYSQVGLDVAKHFRSPMRFLFNNAIRPDGLVGAESEFIIHSFRYSPQL